MVDLKQQYLNIKDEVDAAVLKVLESSAFINGPQVQSFSSALALYNGVKHVVPCANGTDALQISMMALGLQPGDEVIMPSFTYIAAAEVVALLRLTPVFVDVDAEIFCMDTEALQKAITSKTKAVVPVHIYGHAANMEEILKIAQAHKLFVIEDNAQALGGEYYFSDGTTKKTGAVGTCSGTSFFPSKSLGCYGDGGAIMTNDDSLAVKLRMVASHGQSKRYHHEVVGLNSRLDTIQAAILEIKLRYLDSYIEARRKVADTFDAAFGGHPKVTIPFQASYCKHVFHQYTLLLEGIDREGFIKYLAQQGVPSKVYYPIPVHRQKMFAQIGAEKASLPVTDWLTERIISLPIHTEMDEEQIQHIIKCVQNYIS
jgi:UDP-2-acetamido-2-deoxy-ribo-hexuluronate aminotransferase